MNNLKTFFQKKKFSFSDKTIVTAIFWFVFIFFAALLMIDGLIFYRYSYTVVNSTPGANQTEIGLDEKRLNQAEKILEEQQTALQKLLGQ